MAEKCFKKRDARAELLFCQSKPFFSRSRSRRHCPCLLTSESPETVAEEMAGHNSTPVPGSRIK